MYDKVCIFSEPKINDIMTFAITIFIYIFAIRKPLSEDLNNRVKRDSVEQLSFTGTGGGAMFIRWGRNVCPSEDQLVYSGYLNYII